MIDASHTTKDHTENLLQSCGNILSTYAKALLLDPKKLTQAQEYNYTVTAEETLRDTFSTLIRALVAEATRQTSGAIDSINLFLTGGIREKLITERGRFAVATPL